MRRPLLTVTTVAFAVLSPCATASATGDPYASLPVHLAPPAPQQGWYRYDNGLYIERGTLSLRARFRIHYDWVFNPDGSDVRRQRVLIDGNLTEDVLTKFQWDTEDFDLELKDGYFDFINAPVAKIKVGKQREPLGLEALTSAHDLTFLERSSPTSALTPGRSVGVMAHDTFLRDRATWSSGIFAGADDFRTDAGDGEVAWTSRITWLPTYGNDGRELTHMGVSLSIRKLSDDGVRLSARPESQLIIRTLDTGVLTGDSATTVGLEGAWVDGPWSLQGE